MCLLQEPSARPMHLGPDTRRTAPTVGKGWGGALAREKVFNFQPQAAAGSNLRFQATDPVQEDGRSRLPDEHPDPT